MTMTTQFRARGDSAEIWLYGDVGASMWGDGISAKGFQKELTALGKVNTINLRINSAGGDVFDGVAIYNQLKQHPARVVVDVDGLAASIASVIAMAGDEVRIAGNAMMMIHNPMGMAFGDEREMQRMAALLAQVRGNIADTYATRTGHSRTQLEDWMADETWFTSESAVEFGFADSVTAEQRVAACFGMLEKYRKVPRALQQRAGADTRAAVDIAAVRLQRQAESLRAIAGA